MAKRNIEAEDLEKVHTEEKRPYPGPFRTKGEFEDDITLRFDDERELYVSATFLKMMSLVFKTMLESDFKKKKTGVVHLKEKEYDHFLLLLESAHPSPSLDSPVTEQTVFGVYPLAHEVKAALLACKKIVASILSQNSVGNCHSSVKLCLKVLKYAIKFDLSAEEEMAIQVLKEHRSTRYNKCCSRTRSLRKEACVEIFTSLPDSVKVELLLSRLAECDE